MSDLFRRTITERKNAVISWLRLPIKGGATVISLADLKIFESAKWGVSNVGYAKSRTHSPASVYLHRLISQPDPGLVVDHINHCRVDNRRENLRNVTYSENGFNRLVPPRRYTWDPTKRRFRVYGPGGKFVKWVRTEQEATKVLREI